MQKNTYVLIGALVGLVSGYAMFHDGRSALSAVSLAAVVAIVGGVMGFVVGSNHGGNRRD